MSALAVSFSGARVSAGKVHLTPTQTPGAINIDISGGTGAKVVRITEKPAWADGDYAPTVTRHPDDGAYNLNAHRPPFVGTTGRYRVTVTDAATPEPNSVTATLDIVANPASTNFILHRPNATDLILNSNDWLRVFHVRHEGTLTPSEERASPRWAFAVLEATIWMEKDIGMFILDVRARPKRQLRRGQVPADIERHAVSPILDHDTTNDEACAPLLRVWHVDLTNAGLPLEEGVSTPQEWFEKVLKPAIPPWRG